jgi:hypothetical protein
MARKRKSKSFVISIRISDEERQSLNMLMARSRIDTVSDLMRKSIQLFKKQLPDEMQQTLDTAQRTAYGQIP